MSQSTAITKEEVWRNLAETSRLLQEIGRRMELRSIEAAQEKQETDRQIQELGRKIEQLATETNQQIAETNQQLARTDQQLARTDQQVARTSRSIEKTENLIGYRWGQMVESLVAGDLVRLLRNQNIDIKLINTNQRGSRHYIDEEGHQQHEQCELDIIAMNGTDVVVVEVKSTLRVKHVDKFVRLLPRLPLLFPPCEGKNLYGAVAYLRCYEESHLYAERKGLFVIRATGDSASIINKEQFKPEMFSSSGNGTQGAAGSAR